MTANRESRLIKALKRQGGDGLAASRRFFPFCDHAAGNLSQSVFNVVALIALAACTRVNNGDSLERAAKARRIR
jgi:hypothetical protein